MNEENNKPIPEMKDIEFNNNIPVQNDSKQVVQDINPGNVVNPGQQVVNNKVDNSREAHRHKIAQDDIPAEESFYQQKHS